MIAASSRYLLPGALALSLAAAGIGLGGCDDDFRYSYFSHDDKVTLGAGNAPAANVAIQTIDPWPPASQRTQIDQNGKRAHIAVKRYETNTGIPPRGVDWSNGNGVLNGAGRTTGTALKD